ncbi:MAG: hypothetical protein RRY79_04530 [Clostridia bacterium]
MTISKQTKLILLAIAFTLIVGAIVWSFTRGTTGALAKLCAQMETFGYKLIPDDLFIAFDSDDTTIETVLSGKPNHEIVSLSKEKGFKADLTAPGGVTVILSKLDDGILTLYLLNGEIQLAFIETKDGVRGL